MKYFFEFYGVPKQFGCDNGREFINPLINNFLIENNTKIITGLPYNPRSQGAVERIHVTIRNSLLSIFLENINEFHLEHSLKKVINIYNRTVHRVTKFTPNEIFFNSNEEFFKTVKSNIINNYKKDNKNEILFKEKEKILLINNFIKTNHKTNNGYVILTINKVKKKKSFINICAEIIKYIDGGNYLIKIIGNYEYYNLKNNEIYCVSSLMIRKCQEELWNDIKKYIELNLENVNNNFNESENSLDSAGDFVDEDSKENENLIKNEYIDVFSSKKIKRLNSY